MNWKVESNEHGYWIEDSNHKVVADVHTDMNKAVDTADWDELTRKRAQLIASAPELLKALMRLVYEDNGEYFIGTSNLESDGSLKPGRDNGFWKIDPVLSTKTKLLDHPVWCVYKDSNDVMWVGTKDGIYQEINLW